MKNLLLALTLTAVFCTGCQSEATEDILKNEVVPSTTTNEPKEQTDKTTESDPNTSVSNTGEEFLIEQATDSSEEVHAIPPHTDEQLQYAQVWAQYGINQDIDALYVTKKPTGTLVNPDDPTSLAYPSEVIQLSGSRLVDGSITYAKNADGTITLYNIPLRWDGEYPAGEAFYTDILSQTRTVPLETAVTPSVISLLAVLK